jgi:SNF2 family DNA or RNA helicase
MPTIKLKGGKALIPVDIRLKDDTVIMKFPYNEKLKDAVRDSLDGACWNPDYGKAWTAKFTDRTRFNLRYLYSHSGAEEVPGDSWLSFLNAGNPFNRYSDTLKPIIWSDSERPLREYQVECIWHMICTRQCILAAEMGTGKTLMSIELLEYFEDMLKNYPIWYMSPKVAIPQVKLEYKKWNAKVIPTFMTYDAMTKRLADWDGSFPVPRAVIFDESIKIKNPKAKRSQAAKYLTDAMREEYGEDCIILCMSGAPATNGPENWWMQCEVVQPGFLLEKNWYKFKDRLCIIKEEISMVTGATFPKTVTDLDDPNKCAICGSKDKTHFDEDHEWKESKNEVANLFNRMKGLVKVVNKKECLGLPDKIYRTIECKVPDDMMRVARAMAKTATSTAVLLGRLRELSDGFQYTKEESGKKECTSCGGEGSVHDYGTQENSSDLDYSHDITPLIVKCHTCDGTGQEPVYSRKTNYVETPKTQELINVLEEHEDIGRLVIFGGFQGTIDTIVETCAQRQWGVIKVDGRGWHAQDSDRSIISGDPEELLQLFQEGYNKYPRLCFVGQPGAAGKGLTLTASPTIVFYSNDFNADNRIQAEDRIHRIGMDENRGATIIDIFCLPTDQYVKENLNRKIDLLNTTLGRVKEIILGD